MSDQVNQSATTNSGVGRETQQINVVDDNTLQAALNSMNEVEMNAFLEELNKSGKAYLPAIGQTIELLTVPAPSELPVTTVSQPTTEILLQELTSMTQQNLTELVPVQIETRQVAPPPQRTGNTAVKSTIASNSMLGNNNTSVRKPIHQQNLQDERMFFGRPTTIGQGQYHNRTGLMAMNKQQTHVTQTNQIPGQQQQQHHHQQQQQQHHHQQQQQQHHQQQQQQQQHQQQQQQQQQHHHHHHQHHQPQQRRPISWFSNRTRRHSSDDEEDSDRDSSPPMSGNESVGPTRRSSRVPKPKQDADFVTFPLLDRDENGNPIAPTPSMPLNKAEDDEDDIPYRLMDYPRPQQQQQQQNQMNQSLGGGPGRKPRPAAEIRSAPNANKKPARWPDDELYHVKSLVPLIMPQQVTNPSNMRNKTTLCKPIVSEREVEAKPTRFTTATQTEMENMIPDVPLLSLPVPMYLPSPTPSYRLFKPRAVPIPVPFFVPVMIPVPRKAYMNIRDYLQTQRDLLPDDPFQAALILHAESLVRAENRPAETINTSQEPVIMMDITRDDTFASMVQTMENIPELDFEAHHIDPITSNDPEIQKLLRMLPDASDRLKWTYGVEAFQRWAKQRNQAFLNAPHEGIELAQQYLVKTDLLSYVNGDELQRVLDAFLQEVRRPNGEAYSPESVYYLCLGIQYYLNLNHRSIDLFDPRYIEFNSTLNTILSSHRPRISQDGSSIISVINEELLYDVQQLGTTSPWAILTTLLYTNSKYFNLKTVESHMTISLANFGKYSQWVRLSPTAANGQQMNYLRFYAHNPDLKSLANSPTVYEITERITEPLRCPIKQYDFYVSKCPEQVRGAADVFYLRPLTEDIHENSLWFSAECLAPTTIDQILNRLKLIPDFYSETKPVDTGSTNNSNVPVTSTAGTSCS